MPHGHIDKRLSGQRIERGEYMIEGYRVRKLMRSKWRGEKDGETTIRLDSFDAVQNEIAIRLGK